MKAATPNNWQWNISAQHEIYRNTTVEVAYVGNKGYDLLNKHDANQVRSGDINQNGISDRLEYARVPSLGAVRPFGEAFGDRRILFWDHSGESSYHSLQTQMISRFGRGSHFQASYTLARTRANITLDNSDGGFTAESVAPLDLDHPELEFGRPNVGRTHIFNASLVYMTPSLEGRSACAKRLFGDWEIGTIIGAASGQPMLIFTGSIPGLTGGPSGIGFTDHQRPNRVAGESYRASGGLDEQILNPNAVTLEGFQLGTIGDYKRGDCQGPAYFQVDLALYKNVRINDSVRLQLRFEIFNILNRTNFLFSGLNNTMNPISVTFDTPDPANATRITSVTLPASFGQATRTRDERQTQFGIKLLF